MPESTEGVDPGQVTALDYENAAESTESEAETVGKLDGLDNKQPY